MVWVGFGVRVSQNEGTGFGVEGFLNEGLGLRACGLGYPK